MKFLILIVAINLFHNAYAVDSSAQAQYLIKEMESLRNSLSIDDPQRMSLTNRLADLYFDVSIQEGNSEESTVAKNNRLKALDLYKEAVKSKEFNTPEKKLVKLKMKFQMGRLLTRLNEQKMAEPYYLEVIADKDSPKKIVEQSALSLAEWYEDETKFNPALSYYDQAIKACEDINSCNYAYYRKAWLLYKDTKLDEAIVAMEKSLWSKEGYVRENSLTDLILFLSNKEGNGEAELVKIKSIAKKANRPEVIRSLAEAFYVAGNRLAGSTLLEEINKNSPNTYFEVRLAEEFYGFRKWEKVNNYLSQLEKKTSKEFLSSVSKEEEKKEIQAILRRLIVQVDAEKEMAPELSLYLKRSIDVYLTFFPSDELREKMQSGFLASETNADIKIKKLGEWIQSGVLNKLPNEDIRKLRQTRLSLAQKQKNAPVILVEATALSQMLAGTKESQEFSYVAARELYEEKKYNEALPLFVSVLDQSKKANVLNDFAIMSENLILDIYNQQKKYDAILTEVESFKLFTADKNLTKEQVAETKSIEQILVQVQFLKALEMKESVVSLKVFTEICLAGNFIEKSCPNAKTLALKFKDQEKLVSILEKTGDNEGLMVEYELMGRFNEAAVVREKVELSKADASIESYLKVALLYEMDFNFKERNRVLNKLVDNLKTQKSIPKEYEAVLLTTLNDSKILNESHLSLPWSTAMKLKVAERIIINSQSAKATASMMVNTEHSDLVWSKAVVTMIEREYLATNKIKFYGTNSQVMFKKRAAAIEKFAKLAKGFLDGADIETRLYTLHMLKMTYKNMALEILNTPIPDGLDDIALNAVTKQITVLADPFDRTNEDYDRLVNEQIAAITDATMKERLTKNIQGKIESYSAFIDLKEANIEALKLADIASYRKNLLANPEDREAMLKIKDYYKNNNQNRIANYFVGRLELLKPEETSATKEVIKK